MILLNGKEVAQRRREQLIQKTAQLHQRHQRNPGLAVVLIGNDPASRVYVRNKAMTCEKIGFKSWVHELSEKVTQNEVEDLIDQLNQNPQVDAILVQLPLPGHLSVERVLHKIDPRKDADALTPENQGLFFSGKPRTLPCTPAGVMSILQHYQIDVTGLNAVVIGRSEIVGKPMGLLLLQANATVTTCHSRTKDLQAFTRNADLVVVAAGKPRFLGKEDFKQEAVVIDVGIHRLPVDGEKKTKLCGDVRSEELEGWAKAVTPVPGGVGPMTIQTLMENTYTLADEHMSHQH